ncbi:MAG: AEC family transporter [Clostridiales Family XIII bacterium]|jgi:predicted permease|nr:AEC family transporter [Clostridiales Family XIII bacterium]
MALLNIVSIFIFVIVGFVVSRAGMLPLESGKYLSSIVINIAAPCAVIHSMSEQERNRESLSLMLIILIAYVGSFVLSLLVAKLFCKILKTDKSEQVIYENTTVFTNNAFMGWPLAYALYGSKGLFLMVLMGGISPMFVYSFGAWNLIRGRNPKDSAASAPNFSPKDLINVPIVSSFIGLLIFFLQIDIPAFIDDAISLAGSMMTPLCMIVVGIQLTESKIKVLVSNYRLATFTVVKLLIIPALIFAVLLPFDLDPLPVCIILLNVMLPGAAVIPVLAEVYGANTRLAAEATFLTTLFSMITIPLISAGLSSYFGV